MAQALKSIVIGEMKDGTPIVYEYDLYELIQNLIEDN